MTDYKDRVSGWPTDIDWSNAPDGAMYYVADWGFFRCEHGEWWVTNGNIWQRTPYASPENFSWFGAAVERPSSVWSGEGRPPVDTVLNVRAPHINSDSWTRVSVLAVGKHGEDDCLLVAQLSDGGNLGRMDGLIYTGNEDCFRPIRTQAQIEAEEREAAIQAMIAACPYPGSNSTAIDCAALYDAGMRLPNER